MKEAFLKDIIEHPHDSSVRLIYADYLSDNGEEDYAAFIRVQVELAQVRKWLKDNEDSKAWPFDHTDRLDYLTAKEKMLRGAAVNDWAKIVPSNKEWWVMPAPCLASPGGGNVVTYSRGFVEEVKFARSWLFFEGGICKKLFSRYPVRRVELGDAISTREYGGGDDRLLVHRHRLGPLFQIIHPDATEDHQFCEYAPGQKEYLINRISEACITYGRSR